MIILVIANFCSMTKTLKSEKQIVVHYMGKDE